MCKSGPGAEFESRDKRDFNRTGSEKSLDWGRKGLDPWRECLRKNPAGWCSHWETPTVGRSKFTFLNLVFKFWRVGRTFTSSAWSVLTPFLWILTSSHPSGLSVHIWAFGIGCLIGLPIHPRGLPWTHSQRWPVSLHYCTSFVFCSDS